MKVDKSQVLPPAILLTIYLGILFLVHVTSDPKWQARQAYNNYKAAQDRLREDSIRNAEFQRLVREGK